MIFAQISTEQIAQGFGWQAAIVIVGLIGTIVYLVRQNNNERVFSKALQDKIDALQETRINEAKEVNEKITAPMNEVVELGKKSYDVLLNINNKRGR